MDIKTVQEGPRGCGRRQPGGLYLVSGKARSDCCLFPRELPICPTCSGGVKPSRGWTWIEALELLGKQPPCLNPESCYPPTECPLLVAMSMRKRHGLIWVGEKFYKTPHDFLNEARVMGVSRKIKAVPRGFELGSTWVFLAHRKAVTHLELGVEPRVEAGIFAAFLPTEIQGVLANDLGPYDQEAAEKLAKRGITPVFVDHLDTQLEISDDSLQD